MYHTNRTAPIHAIFNASRRGRISPAWAVALLVLCVGTSLLAQTPAYFQAVTNLNPVAYWPMQETVSPALPNVETNLGDAGAPENAFYVDKQGTSPVQRGVPGALAGDSDPACFFTGQNNCYIAAPAEVPRMSQMPFTIELWAWPVNTPGNEMAVGKSGYSGLNAGNPGSGAGKSGGWTVDFNRTGTQWDLQFFGNGPGTGTANATYIYGGTSNYTTNGWQHLVFTYDGTNVSFYYNGNFILSQQPTYPYLADTWNPLCIGAGRLGQNAGGDLGGLRFTGFIDEVAVYTNALDAGTVASHYQAGTSLTPVTPYNQLILSSHPICYYRMDAPPYTAPSPATYPALMNYGSVTTLAGSYPANTVPGGIAGPNYGGMGSMPVASPINGLNAAVDAGYAPELNPTGNQPLTAMAWIRGYPSDGRFQCVMGHSDSSWRFGWNGNNGKVQWNAGAGNELASTNAINDGNWHFLTGVYDGSSNYLYVDGMLNIKTNAATAIVGTNADVYLGGAPDYVAGNNERYFNGAICEAAFFTNALTAPQIQQLYYAAGIPPQITLQPTASFTANQGGVYTNRVAVAGTPPFYYQWYQTNGAPASGQTNATLSFNPVTIANAGAYYAVITNLYGAATSSVATLTVVATPIITTDYASLTLSTNILLFTGAHPAFSVTAGGALPLSYQWYSNNVAVAGATNTSYTLAPLQLNGQTNFYCVVTNTLGMATSSVASITAIAAPTAPYPQAVLAANPLGYWRLNESVGSDGSIADDYWGANNGIYTNTTVGQPGYNQVTDPGTTSAEFGISSFADGDAFHIGGIDFGATNGVNAAFSIEAWVNGYTQTHDASIVSKGYGNGGEEFCLDIHNNAFRFFVRNAAGVAPNATSTIAPGTQWHHLVGVCDEANGVVNLYVDGALAATAAIASNSGINAVDAARPVVIGSRQSGANPPNDDQFVGFVNDVAIYNYALSASQVASQYLVAGIAPRITQDPPANVSVDEHGTVTIAAAATGTEPLSYQWFNQSTGLQINGATNATLVLSNVSATLNYNPVYLHVQNTYGSADSATATLNVQSGLPQIANPALPPHIYVYSNSVYPYTVTATGTEPFAYAWYNGNTPIADATNGSYSFPAQSNTVISVVITNVQGAVTSNPSLVTIISAPTNGYAQKVLALGAVGYWPMQETNAPALGNIETNFGSLGKLADAYYLDTQNSPVNRGITGALAGDSDPAAGFNGGNNCYLATPTISSNLALMAPFTIEMWALPQTTSFGMPLAKNGFEGLNAGGQVGAGTGNLCGWSVDWARNGVAQWDLQLYNNVAAQGNAVQIFGPNMGSIPNGWEHVVFTYDGTTVRFFMNGQFLTNGTASYVPDTWSPLCVGAGRLGQNTLGTTGYRLFSGSLDEVALYSNILSDADILAHYQAGTNASPATPYKQLVLNDNPLVYYRMDAPTYTTPTADTYPALVNYGSSVVVGTYPPNTVPGLVLGPSALGTNHVAAPVNGLNAAVDAGFVPQFNRTNGQPVTAAIWYRGYPSDNRVQGIMGRGDSSWRFKVDLNGKAHWASGDNGGEIISAATINDGNWHFLAGVYDGSQNFLYVDGALDGSAAATGNITGNSSDVLLGGAPDYIATTNEQYLAGSVCEAAFFTNALTAGQIGQLYGSSVVTPTISIAPLLNGNLVITYQGTLLSSTNLASQMTSWVAVPGATSPYTNAPSGEQQFYRTVSP